MSHTLGVNFISTPITRVYLVDFVPITTYITRIHTHLHKDAYARSYPLEKERNYTCKKWCFVDPLLQYGKEI